jgi:hypothetical protein
MGQIDPVDGRGKVGQRIAKTLTGQLFRFRIPRLYRKWPGKEAKLPFLNELRSPTAATSAVRCQTAAAVDSIFHLRASHGLHEHFKPRARLCVVESGSYRRKQRLRTALRIVATRAWMPENRGTIIERTRLTLSLELRTRSGSSDSTTIEASQPSRSDLVRPLTSRSPTLARSASLGGLSCQPLCAGSSQSAIASMFPPQHEP